MIARLTNAMRMQAQMAAGSRAETRFGTISSYNQDDYTVKVLMQPENTETGWLPLGAIAVGNGWGIIAGPSVGDMVELEFQEGNAEAAIAGLRFFNDSDRPMSVPSGEFWLVHKSGSFTKLTNDGKLLINGSVEVDVTTPVCNITTTGATNIVASGGANVTAPAINLGASGQSLLAIVTSAFMSLFNTHTHNDPQGGVSGAPNQQMGASHMTSTVKAA